MWNGTGHINVIVRLDETKKTITWHIARLNNDIDLNLLNQDTPYTQHKFQSGLFLNIYWPEGLPTVYLQEKVQKRIFEHLARLALQLSDQVWPKISLYNKGKSHGYDG
jgi:hypothetical protein